MKGYIKRLSQDIEKLEFKRDCIAKFFKPRAQEECDRTQIKLLKKQDKLMDKLLVVMKQRLEYEQKIHPIYFEDLNVAIAKQSELLEQLGDEVEEAFLAFKRSCEKASEE